MKLYEIAEHNFKVQIQGIEDNDEHAYLQKVAEFLGSTLQINKPVIVSFNPPYDLDKTQEGATLAVGENPNKIFIMIERNNFSTGDKVRILSHEFVHAQQISRGDLRILNFSDGKISGKWKDEGFDDMRYSRSNPWENEAHEREKELRRLVIKEIGNFSK